MTATTLRPELLCPAGTLKSMRYAFAYGADAVYAGQPRYSLRVRNNDFDHAQLAGRHRRGPRTWQALLRGGQHRPAQRQAENLPARPGAGGRHGSGCADHVRSRPDHAGSPAFPADAHPPVGAGQRGELGRGAILAAAGPDPGDPFPRAVAGGDRGNPPAGAGHGAGSVRPRRLVHGLFRALPAVRLHQPPRPQPGHLHQCLPLGIQGGGGPRGRAGQRGGAGADPGTRRADRADVPPRGRQPSRRTGWPPSRTNTAPTS